MFKKKTSKIRTIISAAVYAMLVFVVVYGMSIGVYDGFPTAIPYVIIALFLFMTFRRLYQWLLNIPSGNNADKSSDKKN